MEGNRALGKELEPDREDQLPYSSVWGLTAHLLQGLLHSVGRLSPRSPLQAALCSVAACPFKSAFLGLKPVSFQLFYT